MKNIGLRLAVLTAVTAAGVLSQCASASAWASLQLSQASGVRVGQSISISLAGLPPNLAEVAIGQCKPHVSTTSDCNLPGSLLGNADGQGVWQPGMNGRSITLIRNIGGTDCTSAPGACVVGVTSLTNPNNIITTAPLTFAH